MSASLQYVQYFGLPFPCPLLAFPAASLSLLFLSYCVIVSRCSFPLSSRCPQFCCCTAGLVKGRETMAQGEVAGEQQNEEWKGKEEEGEEEEEKGRQRTEDRLKRRRNGDGEGQCRQAGCADPQHNQHRQQTA
ncbi:hypothetical protein WR25_25949 [Diploscapter pachys]|uniref:Uncharacterized protein n=1 Tax=Diploscapter pachys TaxID=2018661 RepID=A0A2A2KSQ9_9BILA|nr:hypothetical protein WR25_25949 [Diploscapter pachys]